MAATLECWSNRTSTDEDMVEQVLMRTQDRSEGLPENSSAAGVKESSAMQKRFQRLSRNVSEALASLKNSLNLDSPRDPSASKIESCRKLVWGGVVRNLTLVVSYRRSSSPIFASIMIPYRRERRRKKGLALNRSNCRRSEQRHLN